MVKQSGCQFILDGGFDVIFSVLELFHKDLPLEFKASAFECLEEGLDMIRFWKWKVVRNLSQMKSET